MSLWDDLDDGPPEYTAHIYKNFGGQWGVVANTTYTVFPEFKKSRWSDDMAAFRLQMMYGAGISNPKMKAAKRARESLLFNSTNKVTFNGKSLADYLR